MINGKGNFSISCLNYASENVILFLKKLQCILILFNVIWLKLTKTCIDPLCKTLLENK